MSRKINGIEWFDVICCCMSIITVNKGNISRIILVGSIWFERKRINWNRTMRVLSYTNWIMLDFVSPTATDKLSGSNNNPWLLPVNFSPPIKSNEGTSRAEKISYLKNAEIREVWIEKQFRFRLTSFVSAKLLFGTKRIRACDHHMYCCIGIPIIFTFM